MPNQYYEDHEAEAILKLASQQQAEARLTRERLYSTAAELGISPDAVAAAELQLHGQKSEVNLKDEFDKHQKHVAFSAITSFATFVVFFTGIWALSGGGDFWPAWVLLPLSMPLFFLLPGTLMTKSPTYEIRYKRWLRKREMKRLRSLEDA